MPTQQESPGSSNPAPVSDRSSRGKLFLACPNYKGAAGAHCVSLLKLERACVAHGRTLLPWYIENESNIDRARGKAMAAFLKTDATHLLFLDTDIGIDGEAIMQMMNCDKPIIGAAIAMKELDYERIVAVARAHPELSARACATWGTTFAFAGSPEDFDDLMQPQIVKRVGTGCMMIRRDVIERLWGKYLELECKHQGVTFVNLFQCTINGLTRDQIGTDYSFCDRAYYSGFDTWLAPWVQTTHRGEYTFKSSLLDLV